MCFNLKITNMANSSRQSNRNRHPKSVRLKTNSLSARSKLNLHSSNAIIENKLNSVISRQSANVYKKFKKFYSKKHKFGMILYLLILYWISPTAGTYQPFRRHDDDYTVIKDIYTNDVYNMVKGDVASDVDESKLEQDPLRRPNSEKAIESIVQHKNLASRETQPGKETERSLDVDRNLDNSYREQYVEYDSSNENSDRIETIQNDVAMKRSPRNVNNTIAKPFHIVNITGELRPPDPTRFRNKVVKVAVILPKDPSHEFSLRRILPMIDLASEAVTNQHKGFLPGWNFQIDYRDSNCSSIDGPLAAFEFYMKELVDVFIGPGCEYVIAPVARYASAWKIPVLTAGAHADAFQHKSLGFSTLTRMMGSYNMVGVAMKHILKGFGWNNYGMIYHNIYGTTSKGNSLCYLTLAAVHIALNGSANNIPVQAFDQDKTTGPEYIDILRNVSKRARIVVVCANPLTVREIMLAAEELNMVSSGEYVFFNIELFSSLSSPSSLEPWRVEGDTEERNMRAKQAYTAMLTVTTRTPDDEEYLQFSAKVKHIAQTKYNYTFGNDSVSTFVTAFYDAVLLYAIALNETLQKIPGVITGETPLDSGELIRKMWGRTFKGITGDVTIDDNGDRIASYSLLDMHPETGKFEVVANYIAASRTLEYVPGRPIYWAGGRTSPPSDTPECGFDGSLCPDNSLPGYVILTIVLIVLVLIVVLLSFVLYRRHRLDVELTMMTWRINWNDVVFAPQGMKNRGSLYSLARKNSQITMNSEDNLSLGGERQTFVPSGFYKGLKVAIKKVERMKIDLTRPLLLELKKMKDLQHDHLVRFYGACIDPPNCALLTEYCPKGSLEDILENEQFKLDWMFKVSLMHDIARGMHFLHGTDIKSHGSLKSSNCVVDSRFVLKITDFGMYSLRTVPSEEAEDRKSYSYWKRKLWTSPELLRMDSPPPEGTQKGDVYSFGIVIHEIVSRQGVFWIGHDFQLSPKELIENIKQGQCPPAVSLRAEPLRPRIELAAYENERVADLMRKCWAEDPSVRPDFGDLKTAIRKLNKEHEKGNILDNLLFRMEQYANNLEAQVDERTADYLEEKKKCEELLYQLLPKPVAAQLIRGHSVVAETYEQVTIYFSDIVGFTELSAKSSPLEVVDLLNDLYTSFDSIVENFDVYKVETIGDCYMVVSGLPVRNENRHAKEIARMSLALLENIHKFRIRHRPDDQLKLRIGIHTGPCVAGVVGLKMPRYCLFGDTVNTASRMESNGKELRIHVSPTTKSILDTFGTFDLECRGPVTMKGKGTITTYWLNGEKKVPTEESLNKPVGNLASDPNNYAAPTPFHQKRDQYSHPSSRRGSACLLQPPQKTETPKKEQENHILIQDLVTNGISTKESSSSSYNIPKSAIGKPQNGNQLPCSVSFNLNQPITNRDKMTPGTPTSNPKNHKIGNNNWLPKLASPEDMELSGKKSSDKSQDFSASVPLLAKTNESGDSIV